ncbi:hypothetical protein FQR65_LT16054 [Abscondita terminalis]|nr:hypothetical protein FQR65_LT16054 [Abscondita terminalis]
MKTNQETEMNKKSFLPMFMIIAATVVGCTNEQKTETTNPLLLTYDTPFNVPPFDKIKDEHFKPAFDEALKQHKLEIDSIVNNTGEPTFAKGYQALSKSCNLYVKGAFSVAISYTVLHYVALNNVPVISPRSGKLYETFFRELLKKGGAWMTSLTVTKYRKEGPSVLLLLFLLYVILPKPIGDEPALLTFDEATTLFHEFGHALHGLLSNVKYKSLAGTSVPRDFVELPSQIMENWAADPEVLKVYAKHYKTGEAIPDSLISKMQKAGTFDQGFATVEYLAASLLDMNYHTIAAPVKEDINAFEKGAMNKIGLINSIYTRGY